MLHLCKQGVSNGPTKNNITLVGMTGGRTVSEIVHPCSLMLAAL